METFSNVAFLLPITMILFATVFLVIGSRGQAASRAWGLAFLFAALGYLAPALPIDAPLQVLLAHACVFVCFYYFGEALLRHFDAPRLTGVRLVFALLVYGGIIVVIVGSDNLRLSWQLVDLGVIALLGVPLAMVIGRAATLMDRVLVAVAGLVLADILVRVLVFNVLAVLSNDLAAFANTSYITYMQVSVGVLSVAFALAGLGSVAVATVEQYRHAAEQDHLTGLLNRRGFDSAVSRLSAAQRMGGIVMACDIDNFKQVNDGFGHAAGDLVLVGLAGLLLARLPAGALVSRSGGEEFVVFLPDMPLASGAALGQSIRADFSTRDWRSSGVLRQITMSVGLAATAAGEAALHGALARADRALYAAKSAGRNTLMIDAGDAYVLGLRIVPAA